MSWLVDIAGKAEDFLNKIDKNAAVALNTTSSKSEKDSRPKKTEPFLVPNPDSESSNHVFPPPSSAEYNPPAPSGPPTQVTSAPSTATVSVSRQNETKSSNSKSKNFGGKRQHNQSNSKTGPTSSESPPKVESESVVKSKSKPVTQNGIDKRKNDNKNSYGMMNGSSGSGSGGGGSAAAEQEKKEEELIAYLNSSDGSVLNESLILKDEVESQARELKLLTKNHRSLQKEHEELKQALEVYKEKLAAAESARSSNEAEEKDLRKLLEEKESEISSLSSRHEQALEAIRKLELSQENIQRLEQCSLENSQLKSENESLQQRSEMLASQVEAAENHVLSMKTTLASMEKEFTNYKEKAKSILNYKDELIASLKNNEVDATTPRSDSSSGSANTAEELMAEITALKNERELLQADLSQTRAIVDSLKEENIRLEKEVNTLRCFTEDLNVQLKREKETVTNLQSENLQVCQQLSSLQFELEREKNEQRRSAELVTKLKNAASSPKLHNDQEGQNGGFGISSGNGGDNKELSKLKTRVNALSQSLYEKQSLINDLSTDKQLLQIEVERLKNDLRESRMENNDFACQGGGGLPQTVIASQPLYLSESPWDSRVSARMKRMYTQLDAVFCQFGLALRKRPNLRLGMSLYVIFLHLWVFFVLFSWMHHAAPPPESTNSSQAIMPMNMNVSFANVDKTPRDVVKI